MKKQFTILALAALSFFTSCKKENSEDLTVDIEKVNELLNFKGDAGSRVVTFNILTAAEKATLFKKHIQNSYLTMDLNEEQKELAEYAISIIVPEMYMPQYKEKYTGIIAKFGHSVMSLFTEEQAVFLFQNIQNADKTSIPILSINAPGGGECFCKWDSTCTAYADTKGPDCITGQNGCVGSPQNSTF